MALGTAALGGNVNHMAFASQSSDSVLHVNTDGSFRILQITDLQDYCRPAEGSQGAVNIYYSQAGTPVQQIFVDITYTQNYSGKFNLNCFNTEYPYTFVQNLNPSYDFDRDNTAFNARMGYTGDFTGSVCPAAKGSWAYFGLVHAVESHPAVVPTEQETPTEPEVPSQPEEAQENCSHFPLQTTCRRWNEYLANRRHADLRR